MKTAEERTKELDAKVLVGQLVKRLRIDFINEQNFRQGMFDKCDFETMAPRSIFTKVRFVNCYFHCVDFAGSTLTDVTFYGCVFTATSFDSVQAKSVSFDKCTFTESVAGDTKLFASEL